MPKELLFSLDKNDFEIQFFRAGGNGGQNQNKVNSACRIIHKESGAVAESREFRDQLQNKKAAFKKLTNSKKFRDWLRVKSAFMMKGIKDMERYLDDQLQERNLKIESI